MSVAPADAAVRTDIEAAVRRGMPRKDIVAEFRHRASQSAIYDWVSRELERITYLPPLEEPPPPVIAVSLPTATTIPYLEHLQANLSRLQAMLRIAVRDDQIKNPRLALEVTKEIGVQLSRAARINAEIQDVEASRRFLRELADVIHEEEPDIRDRIIRKMRSVGAAGGVL